MKRLLVLCITLLAGLAFQAPAAPLPALEKPPLPSGPLLANTGDFFSYRITYSYPEDRDKAKSSAEAFSPNGKNLFLPAAPRTVTFVRTKPYWRAVTLDVLGHSLEQCSDGENEFLQTSDMKSPMLCPTDGSGERTALLFNFGKGGFPDLDWVSEKTYIGIQALDKAPCLVFVKGDMIAWVNQETRFPVRWQRGGEVRTFQQLAPANSLISLPSGMAKLAESLKRDRAALTRRSPRGG